jgi:hypothetical protein
MPWRQVVGLAPRRGTANTQWAGAYDHSLRWEILPIAAVTVRSNCNTPVPCAVVGVSLKSSDIAAPGTRRLRAQLDSSWATTASANKACHDR